MAISNLYAEKIYSANPAVLWALDDDLTTAETPVDISSIINTVGYGTPAYAYGRPDKYGYYISSDSTLANLKASNNGVPMVYGATSVTTIYEYAPSSVNRPSLILPGFGFLNESGKYRSFTAEMWLRVESQSPDPRKIFGPISSDDGLYVNDAFLTLKIGNNVKSHYISEWGRPMIIHVIYDQYFAGLMVNGEQVISFTHNTLGFSLPENVSGSNKEQDWIGFYSYNDVTPVQIDCVAIYPYTFSSSDAKLHFVWGQAVENPELKNAGYSDVPIVVDHQMSKTANNYVYPGTGRWENGTYSNLSIRNNRVTVPEYSLPNIIFDNSLTQIEDWYENQGYVLLDELVSNETSYNQDVFFKMIPDSTSRGWYRKAYIDFPSINVLNDNVESIYGVFQLDSFIDAESNTLTEQTLFKLIDNDKRSFEAVVEFSGTSPSVSANVTYRLTKISEGTENVIEEIAGQSITVGEKFVAGINISELLINSTTQDMTVFFSNRSNLRLTVAGNSSFAKVFTGKIFRFTFSNSQNLLKISDYFLNGITVQDNVSELTDHIGSYTLFGTQSFGSFILDIAINGTWQDYIPLQLLAKNMIVNSNGDIEYGLDFLQFGISYPEFDTAQTVKTYAIFNDLTLFSPYSAQEYGTTVSKPASKVIQPGTDWATKKYEIENGVIIYPPSSEDIINLGMTVFVETFIPGIFRNPIEIRNMSVSSQAFDYTTEKTPIGTKYGKDIYSYTIENNEKNYGGDNPFVIYDSSTPYLYLNRHSGIELVGDNLNGSRGIEVPINKFAADYYKVGLIQCSILHKQDFDDTPSSPIEVYRISGTYIDDYVVYAQGLTSNTAYIYVEKNGELITSEVEFFINGINFSGEDVVIKKNEWAMLGIAFVSPLDFSNADDGMINITGPFVFNNIADYQITQIDEQRNKFTYKWNNWFTDAGSQNWSSLIGKSWSEIYFQPTSQSITVNIDGNAIYKSYIGSNRLTINEFPTAFSLSGYQYSFYSDVSFTSQIITPL